MYYVSPFRHRQFNGVLHVKIHWPVKLINGRCNVACSVVPRLQYIPKMRKQTAVTATLRHVSIILTLGISK